VKEDAAVSPATATATPLRNGILAHLLASDYGRLRPRLEHVVLKRGATLYRADQQIEYVYFPEDAVVALVDSLHDGRTVEVGIIGREGMVGINIFLGGITTPDKAVVQLAGGAIRMKVRDFSREMRIGSPLQRLLLVYARTFLAVISQSVACSQHHTIERRLPRLLLTMNDYANSEEFLMIQEAIAALLGVRRAGVAEAARRLHDARLIRYRRGRISVLDPPALAKKSCECYRFIRRQYKKLHAELPRLLSRN
jgi:CRP-like cAMP-binding protein